VRHHVARLPGLVDVPVPKLPRCTTAIFY
jgi:hypothetical protein